MKSSQNFDLLKKLKDIEAYRNLSLKSIFEEKAEIFIFLLTRNYCDSSLFDKNLRKARGMKNIILIVFLEEGISIEKTYAYMSINEILTSVTRISTGVTQYIFLLDGYFRGERPIQYSFYEDLDALFNRSIQRGKHFYMDQNSIYFELISSSSCYPSFYEEESPILMNCEIISNQEVLINYSLDLP